MFFSNNHGKSLGVWENGKKSQMQFIFPDFMARRFAFCDFAENAIVHKDYVLRIRQLYPYFIDLSKGDDRLLFIQKICYGYGYERRILFFKTRLGGA